MTAREPLPHWHCNKRWTDIKKTKGALSILEAKFEGKTWNAGKQSFYSILLNKKGLSKSTNPRSARAIMGTFKFFGFAYTTGRKLIITDAGKEFVHGNTSEILKLQLLKWQYPNPFEAKGNVASYTRSLRLFPFRVLLRLLSDLESIHEDELALYVWKTINGSPQELERIKKEILKYRSLDDSQKEKIYNEDPLSITDHEYEAHLRPYILETGLCCFDAKQRVLTISPKAKKEIAKINAESIELKTDWKNEDEWFEYYGDTRYHHPPRNIQFKLESDTGVQTGLYIKVERNGLESYGVTDDNGIVTFSIYDNQRYSVEVMHPSDGTVIFRDSLVVKPDKSIVRLTIKAGLPPRQESIEDLVNKVNQILKKRLDDEISSRLKMRSRITGKPLDKKVLRYIRGARFEQLVYKLLDKFKTKVFDDVIWHGKVGEWGLPIPAQKVSKVTGKKLPDILVFQNRNVYVIETTLLRGRAQWEKPEAVSVPDHIENMITAFKGKTVIGVFIAKELDPSMVANLVTRGISKGYQIIPMKVDEFLDIVRLMETSAKDFWRRNLNHMWNVNKRSVIKR